MHHFLLESCLLVSLLMETRDAWYHQVAAVTLLCLQPEPSYRPLIADVLHSLVPLVPIKLGGTLDVAEILPCDHLPNS